MKRLLPKYLFHYTKYDTALKILNSKKLLLGSLSSSNDIAESMYIGEYRYVCFVGADYKEEGATKPTMWANYGGLNEGCCLCINTNSFMFTNSLNSENIFCIEYHHRKWFNDNRINAGDDILLKHKLIDWSIEKEVRAISKDINCFSIDKCVEVVFVGKQCNTFLDEEIWEIYKPHYVNLWGAILSIRDGDIDAEICRNNNLKLK